MRSLMVDVSAPEASFDRTVSAVYSAATGDLSWRQALNEVATLFSARLAALHHVDLRDQRLLAQQSAGDALIEDGVLQYVRQYHRVDPRRVQMLDPAIVVPGDWYHDHEHLDDNFVDQNWFYQHFAAAYGCRYLAAKMSQPTPDKAAIFALELGPQRGPLNADEREQLRRLGEHVDEALRAYERVRTMRAQELAGHQLLQDFVYPMWLIDMDRFVHYANAPAKLENEHARCLVQRGTLLAATSLRLDGLLTAQLHDLQKRGHGAAAVLPGRAAGSSEPLWLHLSLLVPEQVIGAFGAQPMVLVTLFDPAQVSALDPFALSSLLDLTPAQARVAARLAEGSTPEQIAAASSTRLATVRTHLSQVMRRVGAQRSADLVRMLQGGHALWPASASHGA